MMQLPDAPWWHEPALQRVVAMLGGGDWARLVGGAVRDSLANLPVADMDIATRRPPDWVMAAAEAAGMKAIPTGIAHGTVTLIADGARFEVTTLRRDVTTDGRRATVAFSDDWAEDAARRDFTINALYADVATGTVFDPTGGIADLAAGRVHFIGNAAQRIDEDHLRILRWFRFFARFGRGDADAATLHLLRDKAPLLRSLSRERVADEFLRILALPNPVPVLRLMAEAQILSEIAPEADPSGIARVEKLLANEALARLGGAGLAADGLLRCMALIGDAVAADRLAARLKFSGVMRKRIARALGSNHGDASPRAMAYYLGMVGARDRILLHGTDDVAAQLAALTDWQPPKLPIGGRDILARGIAAGPDVARILAEVETRWIAADFPDRAATLQMLDEV
ncbi:MAG: CCA tRNA nucleotidyltransferase [Sphingomonadaceae bacterium]|nr:CCA tRNA nucleotidyltransferase [Sphingomonadaceae bacterium]